MTSREKTKFRCTKAWREFRAARLKAVGCRCEMCGVSYSGARKRMLQVHHIDPFHYTDLSDPLNFRVLCGTCHETVELMARRLASKKADLVANKDAWLALVGPFLPKST